MVNDITVTVVIPTRSRAGDLENCLKSLWAQTVKPESIIVIDNGSTDNTQEILEKFAGIRIIRDSGATLSQVFNLGWRHTESEIVAYLNDDAVAEEDWVKEIKHWFIVLRDAAVIGGPTIDMAPRRLTQLQRNGTLLSKIGTVCRLLKISPKRRRKKQCLVTKVVFPS
ncbi:MAG: glycosyltransferase family 2 protein [Nitrososphaerota archaeon]|nr:glycosyltransferase family 2 protein [Nitrososphaerota archaeon]